MNPPASLTRARLLVGVPLVAAVVLLLIAVVLGTGGQTPAPATPTAAPAGTGTGTAPGTGSRLLTPDTTVKTKLASHDNAAKRAGRITCSGTGADGDRVQAVYAHPAGTPDRLDAVKTQLAHDAKWADGVFATSAAQTGGVRHVRWVTDTGADKCALTWLDVTLTHGASTPFAQLVKELSDDGLRDPSRHYLVWVDENDGCGQATLYLDASKSAANLNNISTGYAVAFKPCWDDAEPHELIHTFGGVQPGSPHGTSTGHCSDGPDVMCGPGKSTLAGCSLVRLDCGHDDYFSTRPTGWLARHWNTADSSWLYGGLPSPVTGSAPAPTQQPTYAAVAPVPAPVPTSSPSPTSQGIVIPLFNGAVGV